MEELVSKKPHHLLQDVSPDVQQYVVSLEEKLRSLLSFQDEHKELSIKYLDAQEDLLAMQLQIIDFKDSIKELKEENNSLRSENEELNNRIKECKSPVNHCTSLVDEQTTEADDACGDSNANSVLVKGLPQGPYSNDYKGAMVLLGSLMDLKMTEADIRKITLKKSNFYERQNMQPEKIILIVELSHSEMKVNVLKHKEKLKTNPTFKNIEITDFVSADVYDLYQYAKVLKSYGYHSVYWRNNSVYAKKMKSSSKPILISSTSQVDVLKEFK